MCDEPELQIGFYGICASCLCVFCCCHPPIGFHQMRGVFKICGEPETSTEWACLRYMMNRNRHVVVRVQDI